MKGIFYSGLTNFFVILLLLSSILTGCVLSEKMEVRTELIYHKGENVNLSIENFLLDTTDAKIAQQAVITSTLLDTSKYDIDEELNVVSKGKDYLDSGVYFVTISYKNTHKSVKITVLNS